MEVKEKEKKIGLFDMIDDVSFGKKNIFSESEENQKAYNIFMVNLMLSQHVDAILTINILNARPSLSKRMHHDFLAHSLPKKKRFAKLSKPIVESDIELIKKFFGYSTEKALEVRDLISDSYLDEIRNKMFIGGSSKGVRND